MIKPSEIYKNAKKADDEGDKERAEKIYRRIIEKFPESKEAELSQKRINSMLGINSLDMGNKIETVNDDADIRKKDVTHFNISTPYVFLALWIIGIIIAFLPFGIVGAVLFLVCECIALIGSIIFLKKSSNLKVLKIINLVLSAILSIIALFYLAYISIFAMMFFGSAAANNPSNNPTPSVTTQQKQQETTTVNIGDTITTEKQYQLTINAVDFTRRISPSDTSSVYSYFEPDDSTHSYLDIKTTFKNLNSAVVTPYDKTSFTVVYDNEYNYKGKMVVEEDNYLSPYNSIDPLIEQRMDFYVELPSEVVDNDRPIIAYMTINDNIYELKVR